ncbi:carboxypeptidase-like regulatory domain-containing protein, partial [candidate division KSB1 bacterium]|nr:carboxypeptidase-like regulatory domain-containing protein [candidate division KSB1 bacterium]
MKYGKIHFILLAALFVCAACGSVFAGTTGKIMGTVTDKETGEPLIGCNVMVKETNLGAATDMNGKFVILQVPPGNFDVVVHYMGYHSVTMTGVNVRVDLTTTVNFQLESNVIDAPTVTVVAEKSMVQKDVTSTSRQISSQDIMETPGIESTSDILQRQGGFFAPAFSEQVSIGGGINIEPKDPSLKGINIRGSRGGDALILIDGFPSNHPVYGGYDVMNLNVEDIQNIEILTGAFSAEYGQGESAVINITTKSGSDKFMGSLNIRSDAPGMWGNSYDKDRIAMNLSGPELLTGKLLPKLGIKIPGKMTFFSTITATLSNSPYNNGRSRDPLFSIGSYTLDERQDNSLSYSAKLTYQISNNFKTRLSYRKSFNRWTQFEWLWKNNPDNLTRYSNSNEQLQLNFTHTLSNKTFYSLTGGYTNVKYKNNFNGRSPADFWVITPDTMYSIIMAPNVDPVTGFYDERGYISNWANSDDKAFSIKFDLTSQVLPEHLIKIGGQFDYKELYNMNITAGGTGLSEYGRYIYQDA